MLTDALLATARQPFVYGTKAPPKSAKFSPQTEAAALFISHQGFPIVPVDPEHNRSNEDLNDESSSCSGSDVALFRPTGSRGTVSGLDSYNLGHYAWIPPKYRELLGYFTHKMTRSISCYNVVQTDYCTTLMPMASTNPHLLAAVLYLAACHRTSRGLPQSPEETDQLRTSSLRKLRLAIAAPDANSVVEAAIASTLTLCIADIVSEVATPGSWRIHMKGAMTLWGQLIKDPTYKSRINAESVQFLKRWYTSFESIAFGCGINPVTTYWSHFEDRVAKEEYIDDITSFCTALLPVFEEINRLRAIVNGEGVEDPRMAELKSESPESDAFSFEVDNMEGTCLQLIRSVQDLLDPKTRILRFRPGVGERIPDAVKLDYYSCDEAYHHMALLQIYTISPSHIPASAVRAAVVRILTVIQSMTFVDHPCPAVAVLPPLFVAGSQAWEVEDRARVLGIMKRMEECWSMGNVKTSRDLLAQIWLSQDARKKKGEDIEKPFRWELETGKWSLVLCY